MVAYTPVHGLPYESPPELPGGTLTGGPDGQTPILAVEVERAIVNQFTIEKSTYSPTLNASTNPDLGTGGLATGSFIRFGTLVWFSARFLFGTGSDPGSGNYSITVPYPFDPALILADTTAGEGTHVGSGFIRSSSGAASDSRIVATYFRLSSPVTVGMRVDETFSTVSNDFPFTWDDGDRISIEGTYIADPTSIPS